MAEVNTLIEFLRMSDDRSFEDIQSFLERDHSSINVPDERQRTPLLYVLESAECTKDVVRLLLRFGASLDSRNDGLETPLLCALYNCRDEAVATELIENGANVNVLDEYGGGRSPLCLAFSFGFSKKLLEGLFKAGCSVQACMYHENNVWECFTDFGRILESDSEDVMKLVIEAGASVTKVDYEGRSPLCRILFNGGGVGDIKLLISKGASFKDCKKHDSPMLCVTDGYSGRLLKANVLELLLNKGASVKTGSEQQFTALQSALRYCWYETVAIRILLDIESMDNNLANIKHERLGNLLHFALANHNCKLIIVKFLLNNGVRSDEINAQGSSPLHEAMRFGLRDSRIIQLLVKSGSPVNLKCREGYTPLSLAVERQVPDCVLEVLLAAGACIDGLTDRFGVTLLEMTLKMCNSLRINRCKILLKWLLVENPNFHIKDLMKDHNGNVEFCSFAEKCAFDIQRMKSVRISPELSLDKFVKPCYSQNVAGNRRRRSNWDLDQLLKAISNNPFPNFADVISYKFSRLLLTEKLRQLSVYTVKDCLDYPYIETNIVCHYDCLWLIAKYLSKQDLLNLILAFYFTCDNEFHDQREPGLKKFETSRRKSV